MSAHGSIHFLYWTNDAKSNYELTRKSEQKVCFGLVNSEASHNFISADLVPLQSLQVETTHPYSVRLRHEHQKQTQGCCRNDGMQI